MSKIETRLFIYLSLSFFVFAIIGTLSHECGHYIVAKILGYDATIHFNSTSLVDSDSYGATYASDSFWMLVGGPLQTILTGTAGILLIYIFRNSFYYVEKLSLVQWCIIFISLYWLRQSVNFIIWIAKYFITGRFSSHFDEIRITKYMDMPAYSIFVLTAIIGAIILALIIFKFIPQKQRLTFIVSGLAGGVSGYVFWMYLFGKYLLP